MPRAPDPLRSAEGPFLFRLASTGAVLADRAVLARSWWQRLRGLMGRDGLADGRALWLDPCNGIHTWGMRFTIDVVVLDRGRTVVAAWQDVRPWRLRWPVPGGASTVELPAGTIRRVRLVVGDLVEVARAEGYEHSRPHT